MEHVVSTVSITLIYTQSSDGGKNWALIESPDIPELFIAYVDIERALSVLVPLVRTLLYRNRKTVTDDTIFDPERLLSKGTDTLVLQQTEAATRAAKIPDGAGEWWKTKKGIHFMIPTERSLGTKHVHAGIVNKIRTLGG